MNEHGQTTFYGAATLSQERQMGNKPLGSILWAMIAGLTILLLTLLALRSANQAAAGEPQLQPAGVFLTPEVTGIRGQKWFDVDGDGRHDVDEPSIPGWQIFLEGESVKLATSTDISGFYTFDGIPAGVYTITEAMF